MISLAAVGLLAPPPRLPYVRLLLRPVPLGGFFVPGCSALCLAVRCASVRGFPFRLAPAAMTFLLVLCYVVYFLASGGGKGYGHPLISLLPHSQSGLRPGFRVR